MNVCILKRKRNAKGVSSGYIKPNQRRATQHKQKREWRERDEKTEKKSRGQAEKYIAKTMADNI
jgi:hypothetical protein